VRHVLVAVAGLLALPAGASAATLTGTITDGSGQGWPLYARVAVDAGSATYTDPVTGRYELDVPDGTHTITVSGQVPGYVARQRTVTIVPTGTTLDVALPIDGSCAAPGYAERTIPVIQSFDVGTTPAGWSVINRTASGAWTFNDPGSRGNLTGGSGGFAIMDGDVVGSGTVQDSDLVTPQLDLTGVAAPALTFRSDFRALPGSIADVDWSADGTTWTTLWHQTDNRRGPRVERVPLPLGVPSLRLRFRYQGSWDWWWQVDDVAIGEGCDQLLGGLVVGNVKARATGVAIDGATVEVGGATATTAPTPADPANGDGFYALFTPGAGIHTLTADALGFAAASATVTVATGGVVRHDAQLDPGFVTVSGTVRDGSGQGWPLHARVTAGNRAVYTDPVTGRYSVQLSEGAPYDLAVSVPGYVAQVRSITVPPSAAVQDFTLRVGMSCAIGYAAQDVTVLAEPFGAALPANWALFTNTGTGAWRFDDPGGRGNLTGGAGAFATFDAEPLGVATQDADIVTPGLDLSGAVAPELSFRTDYRATPLSTAEAAISFDGGGSWTSVWRRTTNDRRGPALDRVPILDAGGRPSVHVRFKYQSSSGWWWQLDDVRVAERCARPAGGLVLGHVTAAVGGAAINGATVSRSGATAKTAATPADPSRGDGYYTLFSPGSGRVALTASAPGFRPSTQTVTVAPGTVARVDFKLPRATVSAQDAVATLMALQRPAKLGGVTVTPRDVVALTQAGRASLRFDGRAAGLPAAARIDGLATAGADLVLSFAKPLRVPGIRGRVDDSDLVRYDGRAFALWFDGSDAGLRGRRENVDAIDVQPGGDILVSTQGRSKVGRVRARGEDLLRFMPTLLGARTTGRWGLRFDGSDVGLSGAAEDVDAVARDGDALAVSVAGRLRTPALRAADEDVAAFAPRSLGRRTSGSFASALRLDGGALGLAGNDVTALDFPG
jgi:carboxypeptidase family protein